MQLEPKKDNSKKYPMSTDANVKKWLPGRSGYRTSMPLQLIITLSKYELQVGLLSTSMGKSALQPAMSGKTGKDWYKVGDIIITD